MNTIVANINNKLGELPLFNKLPKIAWLSIAAGLFALIVVAFLWKDSTEYQTLFSNLEDRDGGAIVSALDQKNVPYKFTNNGTTIEVPSDQVYSLRLELAEQGLPRGGNIGFELLDEPKFGVSQFAEQINYQRALEGELARSIEAMHPVKKARVHLAIPRQSLFVRDKEQPTASVLLNLYPGRSLSNSQVSAIAWLVSSSVPNLHASAVSVVDQDGALLSITDNAANTDARQESYINEVERRTSQRILTLLNPIVGTGNVRAQVNAQLDFSEKEETSEIYRPNEEPGSAAIRSKQTSYSKDSDLLAAQGVPGALTNEPPANAQAPIELQEDEEITLTEQSNNQRIEGSIRDDATINYEVDRTISHVKHATGVIKKLSVAVVISYLDKDGEPVEAESKEMENLNELVKRAMGYSFERGDTLSIVNSVFADDTPKYEIWENPAYQDIAKEVLKWIGILILALIAWRKIGKPIINSFEKEKETKEQERLNKADQEEKDRQELERRQNLTRYEDNLRAAKELAAKDPRAVVMVLRTWLEENK